MENRNAPAFPVEVSFQEDGLMVGLQTGNNSGMAKGLTKREYFAGLAMQGLLAAGHGVTVKGTIVYDPENICGGALKYSDELLAQLKS